MRRGQDRQSGLSRVAQQTALLFPGQGGHDPRMLDGVRTLPEFDARYAVVCQALGVDVLGELERGGRDFLDRNKVSSLLTVLVGSLSLTRYLETLEAAGSAPPRYLSGYSVGQWTALYAAGCLSFAKMVEVVAARADLMDACFRYAAGGMGAFIGVTAETLDDYLDELRDAGHEIAISNYNCLGQYSVSGTREAVELAVAGAERIHPRKAVVLPVAGAWHSRLLEPAATAFADYLQDLELAPPAVAVIDNTGGDYLSGDLPAVKRSLARHVSQPVLWEQGIRRLIADGCDNFVEIGFGDLLTKFGFFIDRDKAHSSFYVG